MINQNNVLRQNPFKNTSYKKNVKEKESGKDKLARIAKIKATSLLLKNLAKLLLAKIKKSK